MTLETPRKPLLAFQVRRYREFSHYDHVEVWVWHARAESTDDAIEDCRSGRRYADPRVDAEQAALVEQIAAAGHEQVLTPEWHAVSVRIVWQVYRAATPDAPAEYCQPRFEHVGGDFGQIHEGVKLLRAIGRRVETLRARRRRQERGHADRRDVGNPTFDNADDFIAGLLAAGAVRVVKPELAGPGAEHHDYRVPDGPVARPLAQTG